VVGKKDKNEEKMNGSDKNLATLYGSSV